MQQWVGDHMPPTALLEQADKAEQMFYAQCNACSNKQGNIVRKNKALVGSWAPLKFLRSQVLPCALRALQSAGVAQELHLTSCALSFQRLLVLPDTVRSYAAPLPPPPFSPCMLSSASTVIALLFNTKTKLWVAQHSHQLGGDFVRLLLM